jgi:hypothetical protein
MFKILKQFIIKIKTKKALAKYPIVFAYLFGSAASGKIGRMSDIDVAVYFNENISEEKRFELRLDLIEELEKIFRKKIDVVSLRDCPPLLLNRILKKGKKIYSLNEKKRVIFETRAFMQFLDWQWHLDKYTKATMESF